MSAGPFIDTKYEDNAGLIYRMRVQPETLALTDGTTPNAAPAGAITEKLRARARLGRREYGLRARTVTVRFTGAIPDGYTGEDLSVPVLTQAAFNAYTGTAGVTGTYLGSPIEFISGENEGIR